MHAALDVDPGGLDVPALHTEQLPEPAELQDPGEQFVHCEIEEEPGTLTFPAAH